MQRFTWCNIVSRNASFGETLPYDSRNDCEGELQGCINARANQKAGTRYSTGCMKPAIMCLVAVR